MRRKDREITETDEILAVIGKSKIMHLGLFDDGYPYIVPLHFGFEYTDGRPVFYVHCAKEGHKLDLIRRNPHVCVETECDVKLLSGGEDPCSYSSEYASFIGHGEAEILREPEQKIRGLSCLMRHQTGREFAFTEQMAAAAAVVRITVSEYSAKARRPKPV